MKSVRCQKGISGCLKNELWYENWGLVSLTYLFQLNMLRCMRKVGVIAFCFAFLPGVMSTSLVHVHPGGRHSHNDQSQHHHTPIIHTHIPAVPDARTDGHDSEENISHEQHGGDYLSQNFVRSRQSVAPAVLGARNAPICPAKVSFSPAIIPNSNPLEPTPQEPNSPRAPPPA